MINNVDEDNPYKDWVNVAHLLDPPFDYINFADTCYLDARTTNCIYLSILNNHLLKAKKKAHGPILTAIKSFNNRGNNASLFYSKYTSYWRARQKEEEEKLLKDHAISRNKRTIGALEDITDNIIDNLVETSNQLNGISQKRIKTDELKILYSKMTGEKSLYLNDEGVSDMMEKDSLEAIKADTTLDTYTIQETAADLLNSLITEGTKSILSLRKHIKGFKLPTNQEYDPVKHADLTFIENVVIHFIDLALSPRNPLLFKSLERTAAIHTSIFLLNSLFLSYNDKLSFSWIEVETLLTNKTKWDGVGFCPTADKKIGMVLVEMAGGILWNKGKKKAECDYKKLEEGVISFIEYTGSNIGHLVRYHDVKLYFEIIKLVDNSYIRTNCSTIVFPTTPTTFIDFFEEIPKILQWRKSLLNSVNYIS